MLRETLYPAHGKEVPQACHNTLIPDRGQADMLVRGLLFLPRKVRQVLRDRWEEESFCRAKVWWPPEAALATHAQSQLQPNKPGEAVSRRSHVHYSQTSWGHSRLVTKATHLLSDT